MTAHTPVEAPHAPLARSVPELRLGDRAPSPAAIADRAGRYVLRYGLVAILVYIGALKFTAYEAAAIQPLVEHSPLMSWLYAVTSQQGASNLIGIAELATAALIAARPWSAKLAAVGSVMAIATFLTTLTFLVTTPGLWASIPGFPLPAPSMDAGFIAKDIFLLGAALVCAGDALRALDSTKPSARRS